MTYIKKLVMKGFKSFARETTIELDRHMNVIVGPNGSGKSNVTDSLCFVLGRLSIKSIRAAKAAHLIFSGNKHFKASSEAVVKVVFDNSDKTFALDENEITVTRIVRKNGQSIYKINNQTKTRQEVIELLSHAGIDPHGFNIVLQGEIMRFVKMASEDRRKVIEEVAGISVYEMRKEKSIKELDKTDDRLKQVNAVLRERTNFLRNLEKDREQALKFKKLEETVKRCKYSIINKNIQAREKELNDIEKIIKEKKDKTKIIQNHLEKYSEEIQILSEKANTITNNIQKSSGLEQDSLMNELSEIKQEIAGMVARRENYENQLSELERRKNSLNESITSIEDEIKDISKEKGKNKKEELESKKKKLEELEESRRSYFLLKSNLSLLNSQTDEKKKYIQQLENESDFIIKQIEETEKEVSIKEDIDTQKERIIGLKNNIEKNKDFSKQFKEEIEKANNNLAIQNNIIFDSNNMRKDLKNLDICPLCKTKITEEHINEVIEKTNKDIQNAEHKIKVDEEKIKKSKVELEKTDILIEKQSKEIQEREINIIKIQSMTEKKLQLHKNKEKVNDSKKEFDKLKLKLKEVENKISKGKISEENLDILKLEVNELQRTEERNLGTEIVTKQRELERIKLALKQISRDTQELNENLNEISDLLEEKESSADEKEEQAEELRKKYQQLYEQKNNILNTVRTLETKNLHTQNEKRLIENEINNIMIEKAKISGKRDTLMEEISEFQNTEMINLPIDKLKERQHNAEIILSRIGSVNLKALETYEDIKQEYEKIKEKVEQLEQEKEKILKVLEQIDRKKKKTFMNTLNDLNTLFSRNFSQLSTKGIVTLSPQDKKEVFNAGIDISVNVGRGKYFDITSLSGGEQTLVALSLIFAIQDLKPYAFYIFDEIDAALDKRNSEKLAYLLKKHMKTGQYILITHNDSIISDSSNILYGVTMQEGISKVISIEV